VQGFESVAAVLDGLRAKLRVAAASVNGDSRHGRVIRVEEDFPDLDPLDWLSWQGHAERTYWSDRDRSFAMAGVGVAHRCQDTNLFTLGEALDSIKRHVSSTYPNLRYYGGAQFSPTAEAAEGWEPFGAYSFTLPAVELTRKEERYHLACNVAIPPDGLDGKLDIAMATLESLHFCAPDLRRELPDLRARDDSPEESEWHELIERLLMAFAETELKKTVLSRRADLHFGEPVDPIELLKNLAANTAHSYDYCFQHAPGRALVGASPERLYKRINTYIQTEALAGTRPHGETPGEDVALGEALLNSDKDRREHGLVLDKLREVLDEQCRAVRGGDRVELLVLRQCQHLISRIEGMLWEPGGDAALLAALHPTPAVGGSPTEAALKAIEELEPFSRGWFAGPVGWVGFDSTEFAVAIRSGLVDRDRVSVYAGAGIVAGSEAAAEWDEVENKLGSFLGLFEQPSWASRL
jgi:menaquinone-specific isochorismate synthase